jgi:glycosyltransferase involved in cell wall biosynthesis
MPRFAEMIGEGMKSLGHEVRYWTSQQNFFSRIPFNSPFVKKWLGYADQFLIYPWHLQQAVAQMPDDTLFAVIDQALGMWTPHIAHRPHVVHCHDFLALRSSIGEFPENPTGWTGRQYQRLIREGFSKARNFISVSEKTRGDLHRFLPEEPVLSEVVYNGLNHPFAPTSESEAMKLLRHKISDISVGAIIHIGGNQWYKNRLGVLEIYRAYVERTKNPQPLWMIGADPNECLLDLARHIPSPGKVIFACGLSNEEVNAAYSLASVLLFPSLEEGFGWPIIEAMACGCPVITTDQAPMTEVGGDAAFYIDRNPLGNNQETDCWCSEAAEMLYRVIELSPDERTQRKELGFKNVERFTTEGALDTYEKVYQQVLRSA